jgi:hypothetical protein
MALAGSGGVRRYTCFSLAAPAQSVQRHWRTAHPFLAASNKKQQQPPSHLPATVEGLRDGKLRNDGEQRRPEEQVVGVPGTTRQCGVDGVASVAANAIDARLEKTSRASMAAVDTVDAADDEDAAIGGETARDAGNDGEGRRERRRGTGRGEATPRDGRATRAEDESGGVAAVREWRGPSLAPSVAKCESRRSCGRAGVDEEIVVVFYFWLPRTYLLLLFRHQQRAGCHN